MSALSLFDYSVAGAKPEQRNRSDRLIDDLVRSALQQYEEIRAYDYSAPPDDPYDRQEAELVRQAYSEWARFADEVLKRVDVARRVWGTEVAGAVELGDAHGRTMAMLSVTLDDIERGMEEARSTPGISAEEARRELRARLQR
jgi:hypothetical protein